MKIDFNEEKHEYSVNGVKVPSVSEILAPLSAERYAELNPYMLQAAAEKGRLVHEACELIDYGENPEIEPDIMGYVKAYYDFLMTYKPNWQFIEKIVCSYRWAPVKDEDNILYAGTLDRYGTINGKGAVVDIKTYSSLTTDSLINASCQTYLYRTALEEPLVGIIGNTKEAIDAMYNIKRYVLHLKKDGTWRLVDLDKFDNERGFNSSATAGSLLHVWWNLYMARNAKGRKKKNGE